LPAPIEQEEFVHQLRAAISEHDVDGLADSAKIPRARLNDYLSGAITPGPIPLRRLSAVLYHHDFWAGDSWYEEINDAAKKVRRAHANNRRKARQGYLLPQSGD